jgi:hypothetical protein
MHAELQGVQLTQIAQAGEDPINLNLATGLQNLEPLAD